MTTNSSNNNTAEGYKEASFSFQKLDGELFIQTDVCPQAGDAILDLGCGTGELSAYLAGLVGPEGKVIGIDPDKERIQLARQSHSEMKNLSFVEGSASNFPQIVTQSFDIIFSNYALHWIPDKQQAFKNMFESLNVGGKIALHYSSYIPPWDVRAFEELNPENAEHICRKLYQCESKAMIEQYCSSVGFKIIKSYEKMSGQALFDNTDSLLKWLWSTTHGAFDLSLVTEERLQRFLAPYVNGSHCLDFRGIREESTVCRLMGVKQ